MKTLEELYGERRHLRGNLDRRRASIADSQGELNPDRIEELQARDRQRLQIINAEIESRRCPTCHGAGFVEKES